jgi:hypothetical protein
VMTYKELLRSVTRKIEIVDKFCLLGAIVFMDIFKRSDQMNDSNKSHARFDGLTDAVVGFRNSAKLLNPCGVRLTPSSISALFTPE